MHFWYSFKILKRYYLRSMCYTSFYFISLVTGKKFHWYCKKTWYLKNDEKHCLQSTCNLIEWYLFQIQPIWNSLLHSFRNGYDKVVVFWVLLFNFLSTTMRLKGLTSAIYTFRLVLALELHPHQAYPHQALILPVLLSGSEAYPSTINIICYGIEMHLHYCFQSAIKSE